MKQITIDFDLYEMEKKQAYYIDFEKGYKTLLNQLINWITEYPEINDGFEIFDVSIHEDEKLQTLINLINNLKGN